jgi:putative resolvase
VGENERVSYALYARVSSHDQKNDGIEQLEKLKRHASVYGWKVERAILEIGSGLNPGRKKIKKLLADPGIKTIVVEHRDRLARFGVELLEADLAANGRKIVVVQNQECSDDLVQDMRDVMTSLCARWYGRRAARNRQQER